MRLTNEELQAHYRRVHGIADGETYDPDRHAHVPALAFGELPEDLDGPEGTPLAPERDLGLAGRSVEIHGPSVGGERVA